MPGPSSQGSVTSMGTARPTFWSVRPVPTAPTSCSARAGRQRSTSPTSPTGRWLQVLAESGGDLARLSVAGGADLNRDGISDFVIGTPDNGEGGSQGGAAYVVWGGGAGTVDLALVAQGIGGAKVVGDAGSLTGATVAITSDVDGDGTADLMIGAPGSSESAYLLFSDSNWQPDSNIYGTNGDDTIDVGYGGHYVVGEGPDTILGLDGNDTISGAEGTIRSRVTVETTRCPETRATTGSTVALAPIS